VLAGEAYPLAVQPQEEVDLAYIRRRLSVIGGRIPDRSPEPDQKSLRVFVAVFRYQFRLLRAESRIALLWVFLGPAVLLSLISLLYMLSGTQFILGMDVPTFSMLGATTWIMFRNIIFRTSTAIYSQRALLNLRPISSLTIGLAQGVIYLLTYAAVFLVLIFAGNWLGAFTMPANWLGFWAWVSSMGVAGIAVGVLFGAAAVIWPYFLRFAPMIERALEIFSSVFFVSEQLPEEYRPLVLWSPFAHALQLMRSAYFTNYKSEDANPEYFFVWLGILVVAAYMAHRAVRSRSLPM
jgi:ABC-type polysaccharide/polyol phosphate export permease